MQFGIAYSPYAASVGLRLTLPLARQAGRDIRRALVRHQYSNEEPRAGDLRRIEGVPLAWYVNRAVGSTDDEAVTILKKYMEELRSHYRDLPTVFSKYPWLVWSDTSTPVVELKGGGPQSRGNFEAVCERYVMSFAPRIQSVFSAESHTDRFEALFKAVDKWNRVANTLTPYNPRPSMLPRGAFAPKVTSINPLSLLRRELGARHPFFVHGKRPAQGFKMDLSLPRRVMGFKFKDRL